MIGKNIKVVETIIMTTSHDPYSDEYIEWLNDMHYVGYVLLAIHPNNLHIFAEIKVMSL